MVQTLEQKAVDAIYADMREGLAQAKAGNVSKAETLYLQAWDKLPEPKYNWDISQITTIRFAKFYRSIKKYQSAIQWGREIFKCDPLPEDYEPYLVLGTIYFDAGDLANAREFLGMAWERGGKRAFKDEDKKYLQFLQAKQ